MKQSAAAGIIAFLIASCTTSDRSAESRAVFKKPVILQQPLTDSISWENNETMPGVFPLFAGIRRFTDTLRLSNERESDSVFWARRRERIDTVVADGLEIIPNYTSTVHRNEYGGYSSYYYPLYIVNQTNNYKTITGKDSYLLAIQEALDSTGNWRPIESRGFDFCGNGYYTIKLLPGEFVTVLFNKYQGSYKTLLRIRLSIGENIYVSSSFEGTISLSQFLLNRSGSVYGNLKENKAGTIQSLFYGAVPLDADSKQFALHAVVAQQGK